MNGPDPGIVQGDDGEATLDVDMVGSTAPNANILLVVNRGTLTGNLAGLTDTTDGVDLSALYIVTNNLAPIMSQSFGACEAALTRHLTPRCGNKVRRKVFPSLCPRGKQARQAATR